MKQSHAIVMGMALSISMVEEELQQAKLDLEHAIAARERAVQKEHQYLGIVESLTKWLMMKQAQSEPESSTERSDSVEKDAIEANQPATSHVEWMAGLIRYAKNSGITAPEIFQRAEAAAIKMHRNYPYVVLTGLVKKGRVTKRDGRYYATDKL